MLLTRITAGALVLAMGIAACKDEKPVAPVLPPVVKQDDTAVAGRKPLKAPIINMTDTVEVAGTVLYVRDSAATATGLSIKLSNIYNQRLPKVLKDKKLKPAGSPMAWFKKQEAPFFFEAGIPVTGTITKLPKGFFSRKITKDSAFVAHFFGPSQLSPQAYNALNEMLTDRKKQKRGPAYEVYVTNVFDSAANRKLDAYKVQTDIVLPYK